MHNKDIDHLYSLSETSQQNVGTFQPNSIRMKSNLGQAGKAFSSGEVVLERDAAASKVMINEEKDAKKLELRQIRNCLSVPIQDKQNGSSISVLQIYNFDEQLFREEMILDICKVISSSIFNLDVLQGMMINQEVLEASFNLVNDGVVLLNSTATVTKINKSA